MESFKICLYTAASFFCLLITGCGSKTQPELRVEAKTPVKTQVVHSKVIKDTVSYIGVISNDQIVKKSFKVQGRLLNVLVNEGDHVLTGEELMTLEPLDLDFALEASKADVTASKAQMSKAQNAFDFAMNNAEDSKILYEQGAISQLSYDQSVLNLDLARSDLNSSTELYRQAKVSLEQNKNMRSESVLYAPFDGQVFNILAEEGEMVSAGYPVLIISNDKKIMNTGVSQLDVQRIEPGMSAVVDVNDSRIDGVVRGVNLVPDPQTRTYQVSINIDDSGYPVGAIGEVKITVGEKKGMKIPIQAVLSSSIDYVYIIEDGLAIKKVIELGDVEGTDVFVSGLENGSELVIEGMKNLKNLSQVQIIEQ